jgi:hypothetical protein
MTAKNNKQDNADTVISIPQPVQFTPVDLKEMAQNSGDGYIKIDLVEGVTLPTLLDATLLKKAPGSLPPPRTPSAETYPSSESRTSPNRERSARTPIVIHRSNDLTAGGVLCLLVTGLCIMAGFVWSGGLKGRDSRTAAQVILGVLSVLLLAARVVGEEAWQRSGSKVLSCFFQSENVISAAQAENVISVAQGELTPLTSGMGRGQS